ncbi:hypothetical protein DFR49_3385 [Hephaestia caeni]|uniref:YdaS antitoxin of YdaST toxin-antitoxin system n=2 Tax=Hephaestia caeni TaxID=645617 RepID=A0A397NJ18_9SPHN|nr:hypothetical protein DFR49_3385 [Hephaestia caeni]
MHLIATVPNEGARRLAWWIGQLGPDAYDAFAAAMGSHVSFVDRILAGEIVPAAHLAQRIGAVTSDFIDRRDWRRPAAGGWFDPVAPRDGSARCGRRAA